MMPSLPTLTLTAVIDILLVAALVYQAILIVRGRRAAHILTGIGILVLAYLGAVWAHLELLRTLLATLAPYTAFAIIVLPHPGGPTSSTPLGTTPPSFWYFSGLRRKSTTSTSSLLAFSIPATSPNVTRVRPFS